jgi:hypothetical protein
MNYYLNTIFVITQLKEPPKDAKGEQVQEFTNHYFLMSLGDNISNKQPVYLGDGVIMNYYVSTRTNNLVVEMFTTKMMADEELIDSQRSKFVDSLFFARRIYKSSKNDFELSEFLSIDYSGQNKADKKVEYYY